jgi:hypothetical protein
MTIAIVTATAALVSALVTGAVNSWLARRAKVAEELRVLRLTHYPPVWRRTSVFSRWPRTDANYGDLEQLHFDLRRWYYGLGGLVLSENSRARYEELQKVVNMHLAHDAAARQQPLPDAAYTDLMTVASSFRSGLTEDVESRRQRSIWWRYKRSRDHHHQAAEAKKMLTSIANAGAAPEIKVRYTLGPDDRRLDPPATLAAAGGDGDRGHGDAATS